MTGGNRDDNNGSGANPIALLLSLVLAPLAATLIQLAITRSREYAADEHGAHLMGGGKDLASALLKLENFKGNYKIPATPGQQATAHLMFVNMFNAGAFSGLFATHPSTKDRVERLSRM